MCVWAKAINKRGRSPPHLSLLSPPPFYYLLKCSFWQKTPRSGHGVEKCIARGTWICKQGWWRLNQPFPKQWNLSRPWVGKVPSEIATCFLREEVSHLASPRALLTPLAEHKMHIKGINGRSTLVKGPSTHKALGKTRKKESTCTQVGAGGE